MQEPDEHKKIEKWLSANSVEDVEVAVSDLAGIARGKVMPAKKFAKGLGTNDLRLPESLFGMTIDCDFITNEYITDLEVDVFLEPDFATAGLYQCACVAATEVPGCRTDTVGDRPRRDAHGYHHHANH